MLRFFSVDELPRLMVNEPLDKEKEVLPALSSVMFATMRSIALDYPPATRYIHLINPPVHYKSLGA